MKKLLCIVLSVLLISVTVIPCFAAEITYEADYSVPIVRIRGNGGALYNEDGTQIWPLNLDATTEEIAEIVAGVLFPHFFNGILFGQWDEYYDAFYEAVLPIYDEMAFDCDGNPKNGSGIGPEAESRNYSSCRRDAKNDRGDGRYYASSYTYSYDWRCTPYDIVDDLHEYILNVMYSTGSSQVSIDGLCLGSAYVWAYLEKYGELGHIKNVLFDVGISEYTAVADILCGRVELDADALERYLNEKVDPDATEISDLLETGPFINEIILSSVNLLNETGAINSGIDLFDKLYEEIYEGLVPKLGLASVALTPSYWACMSAEDYVTAKAFVFGNEGSEKYNEYALYIDKIDEYYKKVLLHKEDILQKCESKGVHFGAIAKYGFQYYPLVPQQDELADYKSITKYATFGATCAKIGETLGDEYIAKKTAEGLGKYISPDKQIDTSTARFKDSTWVIKNATHDNWDISDDLAHQFLWGTGVTVESLEANPDNSYSRYMIYDPDNTIDPYVYIPGLLVEMTEENCNTSQWGQAEQEAEGSLWSRLASLFRWLTSIFKLLASKLAA